MRFAVTTFLIALYIYSALLAVVAIGKERKPLTNGTAVGAIIIAAVVIAGVDYLYLSGS